MGVRLSEMKLVRLSRHRQMLVSRAKMRGLQGLPERFRKQLFQGEESYCPVCESRIHKFEQFGPISKSWCPICMSMRWQRLAWLFLKRPTNLFDASIRLLHIAPEIAFEPRFRRIESFDYVTADLPDPNVMVKMDVCDIPFPHSSFDAIFCSHVMEHVPDDQKALCEFFRVLSSGGWAVFMVPIRMNRLTDEDLSITDPKERERRFGQFDHVRYYGRDFEDRLGKAGFQVTVFRPDDLVNEDQRESMGIHEKDALFYCQKPLSVG